MENPRDNLDSRSEIYHEDISYDVQIPSRRAMNRPYKKWRHEQSEQFKKELVMISMPVDKHIRDHVVAACMECCDFDLFESINDVNWDDLMNLYFPEFPESTE